MASQNALPQWQNGGRTRNPKLPVRSELTVRPKLPVQRRLVTSAKERCASGESRPRPDARRSPSSPRTPGASVFSIHCPLAPTALQHLSFLLFSLRIRPQSAPPPDAIHLPPSLLPALDYPPFLLFSLRIRPQSAPSRRHSSSSLPCFLHPITSHFYSFLCRPVRSPLSPPTPFIFPLTHFPSPHNPFPPLNSPSAVLGTHPTPYPPTLPSSPLYAQRSPPLILHLLNLRS